MDIAFTVHRVSAHPVVVPVEINGETMQATVTQLEVELVPADPLNGTLRLGFLGKAADEAKAKYMQDATVTMVSP